MSPAEWAGAIGAVIAVGVLAERLSQRLAAPPPAPPRETHIPPQPSSPALAHEREIEALRDRVDALEQREREAAREAQAHRERLFERVAEIAAKLRIRKDRDHGDRGSDG